MLLHIFVSRSFLATLTRNGHQRMSTCARPQNPLVLILGATGTGKSNLAIQIAQSFGEPRTSGLRYGFDGAEIINADAMQLYRGLPVVTNKVSAEEQQGIRHHLLDHIDLEEEPWTVQQFVREADRKIQDIKSRGKLPVVVGGTSYYVHGLLFADATLESKEQHAPTADFGRDAQETWPILASSTQEIYSKLQEVDPEMAKRWHPNDRRKIQRSLEIYLRSGQKASDVYREQKQNASAQEGDTVSTNSTGTLRYDPIIFWLEAEDMALKERLNRRVNMMVEAGLLDEVRAMHTAMHDLKLKTVPVDKSKGIWVSIGYKEMESWVEAMSRGDLSANDLGIVQNACIEAVKSGTRQYAKRQNRYIRIRLADALTNSGVVHTLFLLDGTDLAGWDVNVRDPALEVLQAFLKGETLPEPASLSSLAKATFAGMASTSSSERIARSCEMCDKTLMNEDEWARHLHSRSHKKVLQSIRRRELNVSRMRDAATEDGTSG